MAFFNEPRWSMAAAAITPAEVDTFVSPCNFPGVIFIALSPQSRVYAMSGVRLAAAHANRDVSSVRAEVSERDNFSMPRLHAMTL
jgi:hypothetical protein